MYSELSLDLSDYYETLSDQDAKQLSAQLTDIINSVLLNNTCITETVLPLLPSKITDHLLGQKATHQLIGLPWATYLALKDSKGKSYKPFVETAQLLVGIPQEISFKLQSKPQFSGIYYGSLVNYIADMIVEAKKSVIIASPYWRKAAVDAIFSRMPKHHQSKATFKIITSANLQPEDEDGLKYFVEQLNNKGVYPQIGVPKIQSNLRHPLMHAKTVVCDAYNAYIGSANFTQSGLQNNFEIGIGIKGAFVRSIDAWITTFFNELNKNN